MRRFFPLIAALVAQTSFASAQEPKAAEIEKLKGEVRELREEVRTLRMVLYEMIDLERRRADALSRTLSTRSPAGVAAPSKETSPATGAPSLSPKKRSPKKARPARVARRARKSIRGGQITGKIKLPKGEPVSYVYVANLKGRMVDGVEVTIEQSRKQFSPRWAVVQRGTKVSFPNLDNIYHNVFSRSPGNSFDFGLYRAGDASKKKRFLKSGPVDVFCNIHPRMATNILVVPNQHFAKVSPDGSFTLKGVPPGRQKIAAWAPGSKEVSKWIEVRSGEASNLSLTLQKKARGHRNKLGRPYGSYP